MNHDLHTVLILALANAVSLQKGIDSKKLASDFKNIAEGLLPPGDGSPNEMTDEQLALAREVIGDISTTLVQVDEVMETFSAGNFPKKRI